MSESIKISFDNVKQTVGDVAQQIITDSYTPDVIIGPGRGGYVPGVMLSHYFGVPFHGFEWQFRDFEVQETEHFRNLLDKYFNKNILIIDDINDSGKTMQSIHTLAESIQSDGLWVHGEIKYACLFERFNTDFNKLDYRSKYIETEQWLDFPWEDWWK